MPQKQCRGFKDDGTPCGSPDKLVNERGWCFNHDPERIEEHRAASRRGGRATARKFKAPGIDPDELGGLEDVEDARRWAMLIGQAVLGGTVDHRSATAAVRALEAAAKLMQTATREELQDLRSELQRAKQVRAVR